MTKTFAEIIKGIRKAVLGVEVREDIAQGMEYVEQFATTATQKADEAATSASEAKQAKQDTEAAKETAVSAIDTAKSDATTEIETAKSGALTAIGEGKTEGLNALDKKQQEALDAVSGAVNTAQEAAGTATTQADTATRQATAAASSASAAKASEGNAKTSETESAKNLQGTKEYFEQVRTITIGAQGWYATPDDLKAAVPTGENGWWAVVGTTDTIWTWDSDTGAWKDSVQKADLSDYLTQTQIKKLLENYMPLRAATSTTLGGVKLSDDFTADADGTLHLAGGTAPEPYPVGSIYQTTDAVSPAALFGGTWEQIASERVLMGASSIHAAGTTAEAGLPNITASKVLADYNCTGAINKVSEIETTPRYGDGTVRFYAGAFDASRSSAVYGRSSTVQPAAYYVYIWHRVA